MSLGFFAKFVTSVTGDKSSTSESSPALIVMLIVSPTCAEMFVTSVSFIFKRKFSFELIEIITSSWIWGKKFVTTELSLKVNVIICTPSSAPAVTMA